MSKQFSPWAKPAGGLAVRARQQSLYGLKALPEEAIQTLKPLLVPCPQCDGTGLLGSYGGMGWMLCNRCHGLGTVYKDRDTFLARRAELLSRRPDLDVPGWKPGQPYRRPVLDMKHNLIIEGCPEPGLPPEQLELPL